MHHTVDRQMVALDLVFSLRAHWVKIHQNKQEKTIKKLNPDTAEWQTTLVWTTVAGGLTTATDQTFS